MKLTAGKRRKNKVPGRPRLFGTRILLSLPDSTLADIKAALRPKESRLDLIRAAISRELRRRQG